jgi:AraC-like DNA-binding protein
MTTVRQAPSAALSGRVRDYYGFTEHTGARTRRREGPGPEIVVIVSFGNEWRIGDALSPERPLVRFESFVGGPRGSSVLTEHDGWSAGMQINLAPTAGHMLFGLPMCELAQQNVPLDMLVADTDLLVERLHDAPSWAQRFAILDEELAVRLADAPDPTPGVEWAWRELERTRGRAAVGALCEELGWSRRRLAARFKDEVGLGPKAVARLFRFEHALELVGADPEPTWAGIASRAGYYDQSHLINEFRSITGITPVQYVTNLQDAAEIAA